MSACSGDSLFLVVFLHFLESSFEFLLVFLPDESLVVECPESEEADAFLELEYLRFVRVEREVECFFEEGSDCFLVVS